LDKLSRQKPSHKKRPEKIWAIASETGAGQRQERVRDKSILINLGEGSGSIYEVKEGALVTSFF
jgi:hypothetical protein